MGLMLFLNLFLFTSHAQSPEEDAKQLYFNGKFLFDEARYDEAITAWTRAYEISEKPVLLYNLALAYEKKEDYEQAIDFLYRFRIFAETDEQEALKLKIEEYKDRIKDREEKRLAEEKRKAEAEIAAKRKAEIEEKARREQERLEEERRQKEYAARKKNHQSKVYTALGITAASTVTASVFGLLSSNQLNQLKENCITLENHEYGTYLCSSEQEGTVATQKRYAVAADIGWGLSAVGLGTSLWLMRSGPKPISIWANGMGLTYQGRF